MVFAPSLARGSTQYQWHRHSENDVDVAEFNYSGFLKSFNYWKCEKCQVQV